MGDNFMVIHQPPTKSVKGYADSYMGRVEKAAVELREAYDKSVREPTEGNLLAVESKAVTLSYEVTLFRCPIQAMRESLK